jgi:hypothetical protein
MREVNLLDDEYYQMLSMFGAALNSAIADAALLGAESAKATLTVTAETVITNHGEAQKLSYKINSKTGRAYDTKGVIIPGQTRMEYGEETDQRP